MQLSIYLRDVNPEVVSAWRKSFENVALVEISCGDIFGKVADAIVSPANSFGYMDGGIDLAYSRYFGWKLQDRLQATLKTEFFGELPVGQALVLATENTRIPFLVSAPTMRVPTTVRNTVNVYLAFRAALIAVLIQNRTHEKKISSLLVPGLGTGVGEMPPEKAANQMRSAYAAVVEGHGAKEKNFGTIWGQHQDLLI
jgi:O-acetyl-ADP-ribose deacetylase (regulator of RNase III)